MIYDKMQYEAALRTRIEELEKQNAELAAQVAILRACIDDLLHDDVWLKSTSETELARQVEKRTNVRHELRDMPPTAISSLLGPVVKMAEDCLAEHPNAKCRCRHTILATLRRLLPEKGKEG